MVGDRGGSEELRPLGVALVTEAAFPRVFGRSEWELARLGGLFPEWGLSLQMGLSLKLTLYRK